MQRLLEFLIRVLGPRLGLDAIVADNLAAAARLGRTEHLPTRLVASAARFWSRGWLNRNFFDTHRDWILPYWAVHQLEPTDGAFVMRGWQPALLNQTHRDWTIVGNLASAREALVDPRGLVTPQPTGDDWSLDAWLRVDDHFFAPARLDAPQLEQRLHEGLPLVQTRYEAAGLRVLQEAFAVQDSTHADWVIAAVTVENPRGEARTATVYLSARPFNPEGVSLIRHVEFRDAGRARSFWINGALGGFIPPADAVACSNDVRGDVAFQIPELDGSTAAGSAAGIASAAAAYHLHLPPHTRRSVTAVLPMARQVEPHPEAAAWTASDELARLRRETSARWREVAARGMQIRVPDDRLQEAFDASKAYLLLLHDGDSITPGPGLYHDFWFRDAAYMLNALSQLGYHAEVKQVLRSYPRRLQKDGYYLAQEGEWDANGQALWTLEQHTRLSGDLELLADQYWNTLNAAHWIDAARQKTKDPAHPPLHGLLPAGLSAEHLGPNDYFFWDDFWGLAGLRAAAYAARLFQKEQDERKLRAAYEAFRADVDEALAKTAQRRRALWMPASPYRRADSAMVANLVALYPLQLLAPEDPRLTATLEELRRVAWQEDALFHHVGHSGFGTYLSLHVAGCYTYQRRAEAWPILHWLLRHASPTYTWAEAIHPLTRRGGMGDSPHGWAAADWVSLVRNLLLFEQDRHLVLTPALPQDWTYETMSLRVERAATWFGDVSYTIAFGERTATLVLDANWREPPEFVEWNLPYPLKTAGGDHAGVEPTGNSVRFSSEVRKVVAMW